LAGGEIDILARAADGAMVILEVRGRRSAGYLPRHTLAPQKRARLLRLAQVISQIHRATVRVELVEVIGKGSRLWGRGPRITALAVDP
jgi:Holliday junction resolvase-like predicted endonuclease